MTHDEQGEVLLAAILDQPGDDAVRLVYADWLEEGGQTERAEFVRAEGEEVWPAFARCHRRLIDEASGMTGLKFCGFGREDDDPRRPYLRFAFVQGQRPVIEHNVWLLYRRGFLAEVRCPLDAWRRHGPAVVRAHPVVRVELTDREPFHFRAAIPEQWGWRHNEVEVTAEPLLVRVWWDALAPESPEGSAWKLYGSEEAAREDFGRVLLAWAKAPAVLAQVT